MNLLKRVIKQKRLPENWNMSLFPEYFVRKSPLHLNFWCHIRGNIFSKSKFNIKWSNWERFEILICKAVFIWNINLDRSLPAAAYKCMVVGNIVCRSTYIAVIRTMARFMLNRTRIIGDKMVKQMSDKWQRRHDTAAHDYTCRKQMKCRLTHCFALSLCLSITNHCSTENM